MVNELTQSRKNLLDGFRGWRRLLVPTQVNHHPGHVTQEGEGNVGIDEVEEVLHSAQAYHVVPAIRAVTCKSTKHLELTSAFKIH